MYDGSELTRPDQSQGSAPAATNTTPAPGAAFGGTSTTESKPPAFSFGGSTTPAAQPPANLFGSKPAATGSSGLFGQGNPGSQGATTTPTQAPATGGLFGAAKPAAATGFSFGKPAENAEAPKTGGFSFGKPAEAPKPSGFSIGKPAESTEAPKAGGFSFGKPAENTEAPKPSGFSFGKPAESTEAPKTGGFSFGKPAENAEAPKAGGFSFGKPAEAPKEAPKPSGFSFGKPAESTEAPKAGGFSFGKPAENTEAPKTGGFSFGKPAEAPKEAPKPSGFSFGKPAENAEAPKAGGFSFGKPAENTEAPKTGGLSFGKPAEAPKEAPKPGGFSFGKPAEKKDEPATEAKPAEAGNLFSKPPASTSGTQTDTKPTNVAVSAPSLLRGKSMEDIVKMWQGELDASIKEFSQQAGEVAAYDRVLLKGGDEISRLVAQIAQAEERQSGIDQTLDYVEQQQTELNALLDTYEGQRSELLQASGAHGRMDMGVADVEREKAYALAENLNTQLDDMSRNLVSMIDEVNQMSAPTTNGRRAVRDATDASSEALGSLQVSRDVPGYEDPITQISAILNAHFSSLKWIDEHTSSLRDRLEALRRGQTDKAHAANDTLRLSVGPDAPRSSTPSRTLLDHRGSPATFRSSTSARYLGA